MCEFVEFVNNLRKEYVTFLTEYFSNENPTLREVADKTIEYCHAVDLPNDGNIYLLTFPSGKQYCGQTINFKSRMKEYKKKKGRGNPHLRNALNKNGFESVVIEHSKVPRLCMDFAEIFMIRKYDLMNTNKGYNKNSGGTSGYIMSKETRAKIRTAQLGEKNKNFGKPMPKEQKIKVSIAMTGKKNPFYGKTSEKHPISKPVVVNWKI